MVGYAEPMKNWDRVVLVVLVLAWSTVVAPADDT
jgi:hypothetical protein